MASIHPAVDLQPGSASGSRDNGMPEFPEMSPCAVAFPKLDASDLAALAPLADRRSFDDGQIVFRAGDADLDLFVVESGAIEIRNPVDDRVIVTHGPGQFAGDIDLLTRRPVIVTGIARGPTQCMRVPQGRPVRNAEQSAAGQRKSWLTAAQS